MGERADGIQYGAVAADDDDQFASFADGFTIGFFQATAIDGIGYLVIEDDLPIIFFKKSNKASSVWLTLSA